jgi:DNA-binding MarR family transcriptional regulator
MEPITDLSALRAILDSLQSKGLVTWLTPEGRGRVVSHTLFSAREMENLRAKYAPGSAAALAATSESEDAAPAVQSQQAAVRPFAGATAMRAATPPGAEPPTAADGQLRQEVEELRSQVAQLRADLDELAATLRQTDDDLHQLRRELGA